MNDVINMRYPDDKSVEDRIKDTPHASLHARHVLALQAADKALRRKNNRIYHLLEENAELAAELLRAERQIKRYERLMDAIENSNPEAVHQLLQEYGLAKVNR